MGLREEGEVDGYVVEEGGYEAFTIAAVCERARVEEIARMLGGLEITETTRKHAAELLA